MTTDQVIRFAGYAVVYSGVLVVAGGIAAGAAWAFYELMRLAVRNLMESRSAWHAWVQMKVSHRLFHAWALDRLRNNQPIRGAGNELLPRSELAKAFAMYDRDEEGAPWRALLNRQPEHEQESEATHAE